MLASKAVFECVDLTEEDQPMSSDEEYQLTTSYKPRPREKWIESELDEYFEEKHQAEHSEKMRITVDINEVRRLLPDTREESIVLIHRMVEDSARQDSDTGHSLSSLVSDAWDMLMQERLDEIMEEADLYREIQEERREEEVQKKAEEEAEKKAEEEAEKEPEEEAEKKPQKGRLNRKPPQAPSDDLASILDTTAARRSTRVCKPSWRLRR